MKKRKSAKLVSAEVIAEGPATRKRVLPLADFATIGFADASVNGSLLIGSTPGIEPITIEPEETVKASPSAIGEGGFSDSWHNE